MRTAWIAIGSVAGSITITALTGLLDVTPGGLVGARWYGLPYTWIRRLVVAPQYNPWAIDYSGLILDVLIWLLLVSAVLYAALWFGKRRL